MQSIPPEVDFSLVRGDPLHRAQRAIGLIPARGLGTPRRILIFVGLAWLPLALWAAWNHLFFPGVADEPLLRHFGIHARFLVALPLFIAGEGVLERTLRHILPQFVSAGLVDSAQFDEFRCILRATGRMRDSRSALALALLLVALAAWTGWGAADHDHELVWSRSAVGADFVAFWFNWVSRPIFLLVTLAWLWRLAIVTWLFARISRLDLRFAPTHPDRVGGLGFVELLPTGFAPVFLGVAVVIASRWAHELLYHGGQVKDLQFPAVILVLGSMVIGIAPLTVFVPTLAALKRRTQVTVGALMAEHGRYFERRWLRHEEVDDRGMLGAPEIGPVADTVGLFDAVSRMRIAPLSRRSILPIALATALPLVPVLATQMPLKQALLKVLAPLIGL
jgi:hypothetical protein